MTSAVTDLPAMLRAYAQGDRPDTAAVELLIAHRVWLSKLDANELVWRGNDPDRLPLAEIKWEAAIHHLNLGRLPCSTSEGQILRLAASLSAGVPVDLRDALTGLDATNGERVTDALGRVLRVS